jgi:pilus assembly protein TadC
MAKVILEFDGIEEQEELRTALDGYKYKFSIAELDQKLRSCLKNGISILETSQDISDEEYKILEKVREELREILNDNNLTIE